MERSEIIRQLMLEKNIKVSDVSKTSGIAYSTVKSILENGMEKASYINICKICDAIGITPDELEHIVKNNMFKKSALSTKDLDIINKYHSLDDLGRLHIDYELDREAARVAELKQQADKIKELESANTNERIPLRIYTYLRRIACAGNGFYFDDIPIETIEAPYREGADFIIGVNGDSMEPDYYNGDLVYVKKVDHLNYGDVGIFTIKNECYIKEFGKDGLISRNEKYSDISGDENIRLIGKVIDKVEENFN